MKKLNNLFFVVALLFGFTSQAQDFILKGGLNINGNSSEGSTKTALGFHLGLGYQVSIEKAFAFETGLYYDTRGYKYEYNAAGINVNAKSEFKQSSLTIPFLAKLKIPVGRGAGIFVNAGPYANIGLSFKNETSGNVGIISSSSQNQYEYGSQAGQPKRLGFGLNFGGGLELSKVIIGVGYDLGLTPILNEGESKFNAVKISLGFKF